MFSEITLTPMRRYDLVLSCFFFILLKIIFNNVFRVLTSKSFEVFGIEYVNFEPVSRKKNYRIHLQFYFDEMSPCRL